jgi:hypothetical protein
MSRCAEVMQGNVQRSYRQDNTRILSGNGEGAKFQHE